MIEVVIAAGVFSGLLGYVLAENKADKKRKEFSGIIQRLRVLYGEKEVTQTVQLHPVTKQPVPVEVTSYKFNDADIEARISKALRD